MAGGGILVPFLREILSRRSVEVVYFIYCNTFVGYNNFFFSCFLFPSLFHAEFQVWS